MPNASIVYIVDPTTSPKRVTLRRQDITKKVNTTTGYPKVGTDLLLISDLQSGKFSISNFILKPVFIFPINNSIDYIGDVTIRPYTPAPTFKGAFSKVIIELAADKAFTNIISRVESTTNLSTAKLMPTISKSKCYLRARHVSGQHMSDWSDIITVTVAQLEYVAQPTILNPLNNSVGNLIKHLYIKTSPFTVIGANDSAHEYTEYQLSKNNTFTSIVSTDYVRNSMTDIIISNVVLDYSTDYYIRVRYKGTKYGTSPWSSVIKIRTQDSKVDLGVDGNNTLISGNDLDGAYYGEIDFSRLVSPNYRGEFKPFLNYTANNIVLFDTKKYRSLVTNVNVLPTDKLRWEEYTDNGIATSKWLLDTIGIGYGLADNNIDGLSNGGIAIGNLVNDDTNWLKFVYDEKVLYMPKKPIINTIAWNDLAKRYVTSKKRTVVINNRLYYVRLLTESEYAATLVSLTNGTLGNVSATDLDLNRYTWLEDNTISAVKTTISGVNNKIKTDSMSRSVAYRPVLELINVGDEPYNNLPSGLPIADNEVFNYDANTDTGYFGVVKSSNFVTGEKLANDLGLGVGVMINSDSNWFKFYYHGMIIFTPMKPLRHSILKQDLLNLKINYGIDLGTVTNQTYTLNSKQYKVGVLSGATKIPSEKIDGSGDPQATTNFLINVKKEIGKGSMWNELIYRVHGTFVDDVLANQDTLNYVELHGGVQIGENFANYSSTDLGIADGDGSNALCQEVSSGNPLETISRGYYFLPGIVRQAFNQRLAIFGWRPILILN